ncbi:hypothetical protein AB9W56_004263 [Vibrio vulnificus]|uniref:DUF6864 domain-containing function n=1 Tax=Vibrio vulnificus TaxID=672 RepID=UPI001A2AD083|nr:hypothetical protein [Vibrio vulnificus]ELX4126672.1 hypothetical protein [Vibrio vulnificus]WIL73004.1 hypothetical protein QPX65_08615 [Vibrio vulnificus]HAT8507137.1 hypothetical protein [Vibrio vulnificus]
MKITTGNLEVFESGLVRTGFSNNIKFDFTAIWVEFTFILEGKGDYRADYVAAEDGKGLRVNIYNNDTIHGAGVVKPINLGSLDGRELWVTYRSFRVSNEHDAWSLEYVFYKGQEVDE